MKGEGDCVGSGVLDGKSLNKCVGSAVLDAPAGSDSVGTEAVDDACVRTPAGPAMNGALQDASTSASAMKSIAFLILSPFRFFDRRLAFSHFVLLGLWAHLPGSVAESGTKGARFSYAGAAGHPSREPTTARLPVLCCIPSI